MSARTIGAAALLVAICGAGLVAAEPAVGWRGDGSGRLWTRGHQATGRASRMSFGNRTAGRSISSPIVVGDFVFSLAHPSELVCLDGGDGHIVWQRGHIYADVFGEPKAKKIEEDHRLAGEIEQQLQDLKKTTERQGAAGPRHCGPGSAAA